MKARHASTRATSSGCHCTPVGVDSTVSLDIVKLHSGMIPEPRERYHSAHYYCYFFNEDKGWQTRSPCVYDLRWPLILQKAVGTTHQLTSFTLVVFV